MGAALNCKLDPAQFAIALRAAEWVRGFYPDVTITVDREAVLLASDAREEGALRAIWQSSLANERLFELGRDRRAGVLAELVA